MDRICPRCQALLGPTVRFCPECGAPQLTVDEAQPEDNPAGDGEAAGRGGRDRSEVAWPTAMGTAALLAIPAGLLSSLLSFSSLWVMAGGIWTVLLYRKRTMTGLTPGLGGRIGCVFGVFAATLATLFDAANLLVTRYGLHRGSEVDSRLHTAMQAGIDRVLASNPEAAHQIPWFFQFWLSPEGQAGLVLASAVLSAGTMLGFSVLGGALGARYLAARRS